SNFIRRSSKSDEVKKIEKSISKINKDLLINDFSSKLFVDFTSNWTNDDGYVVSVKNYLDTAKNNKFNELLSKADSVRNEIDMEPSFDQQGNLSLSWYKQDPKYIELEKIKNWIQLMTQEKDQIINNVKDKIFSFKDAFYRTSDRETISSILPIEQSFSKIEKNDKNRKILFIFLWSFFATITIAILFIVLFIFV
ncbi:MAG: hypothetical protein K2H51_01670, partial [Malacoplasma sp.]|nr:hypothetical protein [Malacoplasma sp.]